VLSLPFPLSGVVSPLADIATPLHCVTLFSHEAKMSSLSLFQLLTTLRRVASHLESKSKHWIHTTVAGHPPWTDRLPLSTNIKMSSQPWPPSPPLNRVSILHSLYVEHHVIRAPPVTVILFHRHPTSIILLRNDSRGDELVDHLSLFE
jgi:hypothetical protein